MIGYKAVRKDKTSHYDKTTKWKAGKWIIEPNTELSTKLCVPGIHSSPTLLHAVSYQQGPSLYCEVEIPEIYKGNKNIQAFDETKTRSRAVKVIRWLEKEEVDSLAGFKLWEANNPVNPLQVKGMDLSTDLPKAIEWLQKYQY